MVSIHTQTLPELLHLVERSLDLLSDHADLSDRLWSEGVNGLALLGLGLALVFGRTHMIEVQLLAPPLGTHTQTINVRQPARQQAASCVFVRQSAVPRRR